MTATEPEVRHKVIEPLQGLLVPIESLKGLPGNARRGDVEALKKSYHRWGQRKPIVATLDGTVTAGNHSLLAFKELGWTHVAAVKCDDDDREAVAFALTDNRTHDLGDYDQELLADALRVVDDPELLAVTGYDSAAIQAIFEQVAPKDRRAAQENARQGGNPVVQYQLIFDSDEDQQVWFRFVRWLKRTYSDEETLSSRLAVFLQGILPEEEGDAT